MNPVCLLTGHFVTPVGNDPWTGLRHDYSASENFQEQWTRVNRACYGANSASRILTGDGRIRDIVNNYRFLNASFSPALLDEWARTSPNVYRRLREADAESVKRWGHGNALARPWQEVILPLLPPDRAARQIDWGLRAFEHHFQRPAEGFCLPYDAVSFEVIDLLIERGLRFVLLSGHQAEGLMPRGSGSWQSLGGQPAPGDRAFQVDRPGGSLAVFFPDEGLSRGLAERGWLRDAEQLNLALRDGLKTTGFVHAAAPGEVFGLWEPFADMCLAALWERLDGASPVDVANYGWVLEHRPARELVKLKRGDDEKGTSSVCPHGVARWYRECGCRSSATSQAWKEPLWNHLLSCEATLTDEFVGRARALGVTQEVFVDALPRLALGQPPRPWVQALRPNAGREAQDDLLSAARGYLNTQTLLNAGLWHGDDPTQVGTRYGLLQWMRTLDFSAQDSAFVVRGLEAVPLPDGRNLATYWQTDLVRRRHDPRFTSALFLLDRILRPRARYEDAIGPLSVVDFSRSRHEIDEGVYRYTGQLNLLDAQLDRALAFEYLLLEDHREGVSLYLKPADDAEKPEAFDLQDLPVGDRSVIVRHMGNDLEVSLASETQTIFPLLRKSLVYARLLDVPPLPMAASLMELAVTRKLLGMTEGGMPDAALLQDLEEELGFARDFGLRLDEARLTTRFSRWVAQALADPDTFTSETVVKSVETLLLALGRWGYHPDLTVAQALVFEALRDRAPQLLALLEAGQVEALHELKRLLRLGGLLWIDTTRVKDRLLEA